MKASLGAPLSSASLPSRRAAQPQAAAGSRARATAAARAAAQRAHLSSLEASNYNEDAAIGLQLEAGMYVEGGAGAGARRGAGGGKRGGGGSGGGGGGGGGASLKRPGPWVRANRLRRLPEVLCVELGALTGEGGRPVAECPGLPSLAEARAAAAALAHGSQAAPAAALAADCAVRFIAASALPAVYPARRFCAVCGAPGRYSFPGGMEYVCSLPCKSQYTETQGGKH